VAQQTLPPCEVLFVDSNSTDNSFDIIQEWISKNGNRYDTAFRNIREGTNVPSSSKNVGIRNARYDILAFMDCGLSFGRDWLQKQMEFLKASRLDIVSGVCYFEGVTLIDKSAIAQTYGYKRFCPTVPSSLVKKLVFEKTGHFLEGRRAGYDVDWANKLKALDIIRGINFDAVIRYNGINYGKSLKEIFLKNMAYSQPTIGLYKYYYPYYYLFLALLAVLGILFYGTAALPFVALYFFSRGYLIPVFKSGGGRLFYEYPLSLLVLPVVGLTIDAGKLTGYLKGAVKYIFNMISKRG